MKGKRGNRWRDRESESLQEGRATRGARSEWAEGGPRWGREQDLATRTLLPAVASGDFREQWAGEYMEDNDDETMRAGKIS